MEQYNPKAQQEVDYAKLIDWLTGIGSRHPFTAGLLIGRKPAHWRHMAMESRSFPTWHTFGAAKPGRRGIPGIPVTYGARAILTAPLDSFDLDILDPNPKLPRLAVARQLGEQLVAAEVPTSHLFYDDDITATVGVAVRHGGTEQTLTMGVIERQPGRLFVPNPQTESPNSWWSGNGMGIALARERYSNFPVC